MVKWNSPCRRCGAEFYDDGRYPSPYCGYACLDAEKAARTEASRVAERAQAEVMQLAEDAAMLWPRIVHKRMHVTPSNAVRFRIGKTHTRPEFSIEVEP